MEKKMFEAYMNVLTAFEGLPEELKEAAVCTLIDTVAGKKGMTGDAWLKTVLPVIEEVNSNFGVLN